MAETEKPVGGTAWELDQAGEQMIEAMRMDDPEAVALAMRRFSEGLRNVSMGVVGAVISPLSAQLTVISAQLEKRDRSDLIWRADIRDHIDRRFDAYSTELDRALAALEVNGARLGKLEESHAQLLSRLAVDEARLDAKRERLDVLEKQINELKGPPLTAEQREYYAKMFFKMVEWFAAEQGLD